MDTVAKYSASKAKGRGSMHKNRLIFSVVVIQIQANSPHYSRHFSFRFDAS